MTLLTLKKIRFIIPLIRWEEKQKIIKIIIDLPHQTVHEQMIVAYRKKRVETYMEKLLFKPTHFTKIYWNSDGLFCLTEPKSQM